MFANITIYFIKSFFFFDFWKNVAVSLFGCNNMPMRAGAVLALLLCVSVFYFQQIRSALMSVVSLGVNIGQADPPPAMMYLSCLPQGRYLSMSCLVGANRRVSSSLYAVFVFDRRTKGCKKLTARYVNYGGS